MERSLRISYQGVEPLRKCARNDDSAVTFIKMDYVENN